MGIKQDRREMYQRMVGTTVGRTQILEYLGTRHGYSFFKCRCSCGAEFEAKASLILSYIGSGRTRYCPKCIALKERETLCWTCGSACDKHKCPWAGGKPRDDWEATPTKIERAQGEYLQSYLVIKCPGYEPDRRTK